MSMLDLQSAYLALTGDGRAALLAGDTFFERLSASPPDMAWLVGIYALTQDWPNWERHPAGHEILLLLEGRAEMTFDQDGVITTHLFEPGRALVVPPGVWHTARVIEPGRMLGVTYGEGTEHRPV